MRPEDQSKQRCRELARAVQQGISWEARGAASIAATNLLLEQKEWQNAKSVLLYVPLRDELNLLGCIEAARAADKVVTLPRYSPERSAYGAAVFSGALAGLRPGHLRIPEPDPGAPEWPLNRLDLALAPGVAFDMAGRRLGRGRGFYDRLLSQVSGVKCGVALDEQVAPALPCEPHDIPMHCLLTPTRFLRFPENIS